MGLAYRGVGKQDEALHALETALELHSIEHTRHALGQQKLICASHKALSGDTSQALSLLDDGVTSLKELDNFDNLIGGRYYPIVALAEGHVFVTKTLYGDQKAKELAGRYVDELTYRLNREGAIFRGDRRTLVSTPQFRAKRALQRLNRYIHDNKWEFGADLASIMSTDLPDSHII